MSSWETGAGRPHETPILPDYTARSVLEVDFAALHQLGKTDVLIDLDLTLRTGRWKECEAELVDHLLAAKQAGNISSLTIVTNSRHDIAPQAAALDAAYVQPYQEAGQRIAKPQAAFYQAALDAAGANADTAVMIGDRYELDVVGAAQAGITTVLVEPLGRDYFPDRLRRTRRRDQRAHQLAQTKAQYDSRDSDRDFNLMVTQKRKSPAIYGRLVTQALRDGVELLGHGSMPFDREKYIYEGCKAMADYCYERGVGDIIFIDKSARALWKGVHAYWQLEYGGQPHPAIHFMNPALIRRQLQAVTDPGLMASRLEVTALELEEQLLQHRSPLLERRNEPVLLADACMHSGKAVYMMRRVLETAGFSDLHTGVINTTLEHGHPLMPEVCGTSNVLATRCFRANPEDSAVQNNERSIYSQRVDDPAVLQAAGRVRRHIQKIMSEHYQANV